MKRSECVASPRWARRLAITAAVFAAGYTSLSAMPTAQAASVLDGYNLVVLHNLNGVNHVAGRTFVGGNLAADNAEFGAGLSQSDYSANPNTLTVAGHIRPKHKNALTYKIHGDLAYNGSTTIHHDQNMVDYLGGFGGSQNAATTTQADFATAADDLSTSLKDLTPNETLNWPTSLPGGVTFSAAGAPGGTAVFSIEGDELFNSGDIQHGIGIDLGDASSVVINVSGTSLDFHADNFLSSFTSDAAESKVIWNFYEARNLTIHSGFHGMVLAPNATLFGNSQNLDGAVMVRNLNDAGEVHLPTTSYFSSYRPASDMIVVPAPSAGWSVLALLGLWIYRVIWRRKIIGATHIF